MNGGDVFSFRRLWAMVVKEFIQMARDRMTFAMILGIPVMQLMVFGFVINTDPRHMATAVLVADSGPDSLATDSNALVARSEPRS